METYSQMKKRHQEEFNALPKFAAFTEEQFEKGKAELGIKDDSEVYSLGYGVFFRKADKPLFDDQFKRQYQEREAAMKDFDFCVEMFLNELANHEYIVTGDAEEAIKACGLHPDEVNKDDHLNKAFVTARKRYLKAYGE